MERSSGMTHGGVAYQEGLGALLIPFLSLLPWHRTVNAAACEMPMTISRTHQVAEEEVARPAAQSVPVHVGLAPFAGMLFAGLIMFMIMIAVGLGSLLFVDYLERSMGSSLASATIRVMAYVMLTLDLLLFIFYVTSAVYLRLRTPSVKPEQMAGAGERCGNS
ncbi:hypothetical protein AWB80_05016 [Caballeronia pedi]|uniref:Uncharacterized protein n=1 Tax=Caballeronia pedi TaxID=1777141 RepID=A0A158CF30_9BURK|nr:hypothetical protein [Caballeronia pedi]SAK80127.1 hypothetical protein AWB80_05016 [Caballeronia pedi]